MKALILYFSTGMGHKNPAIAIAKALGKRCKTKVLDCADLGIPDVEKSLTGFWKFSLAHPFVLRILYAISDNIAVARLGLWLHEKKVAKRLKPYISKMKPDIIVATHMTAAAGAAKAGYPAKVVTTEPFNVHALWAVCGAEEYLVPSEPVKSELRRRGVKVPITVTGYPLNPDFTKISRSRQSIRKELGLREGKLSILFTGGGEGISNAEELVKKLKEVQANMDFVIICGKNRVLYERLINFKCDKPRLIIKGFVDKMNEHIFAVDMVAGKAGANTVLEALVMCKPFCCTHVMANEEPLSDYVVRNGFGWKTIKPNEFADLAMRLTNRRNELNTAIKKLSKANIKSGADEIARHLLSQAC